MMSMGFGMVRIKFLTLVNPPAHNHRRIRIMTAAMSTHLMTVRIIQALYPVVNFGDALRAVFNSPKSTTGLYVPLENLAEFFAHHLAFIPRAHVPVRCAYFRIYPHAGQEYRDVFPVCMGLREFESTAYCRAPVQNNLRFCAHAAGDIIGDFLRALVIRDVVCDDDGFAIGLGKLPEYRTLPLVASSARASEYADFFRRSEGIVQGLERLRRERVVHDYGKLLSGLNAVHTAGDFCYVRDAVSDSVHSDTERTRHL